MIIEYINQEAGPLVALVICCIIALISVRTFGEGPKQK